VALVVTVCANKGVPIAAAISGSKIFMPKVFYDKRRQTGCKSTTGG
jgi:hypothetical protein